MTAIDLFAGAGGMSEGFSQAGFQTLFANDHEKPALATYRRNHDTPETSSDDIESIDAGSIRNRLGLNAGDLDVLVGGPPCQGFSTYGKRDEDDARNQLYMHFIRFLEEFKPKAYVIENVTGIISMSGGLVVEDICRRLRNLGYGSAVWTLDAREYGVPQRRKRVFITGLANGLELAPPIASHAIKAQHSEHDLFGSGLPTALTIHDAISDLPARTLKPRQTHEALPYEAKPQTDYQKKMREGSDEITNHSSKQMLGIRRLRLALMHPGDYGTKIEERLASSGLSEDIILKMLGGDDLRDMNECRKEDREKELLLRKMLSEGNTTIDTIKSFMDSQGFANKYRRLKWDEPSHTLVAHMARDCSDFVHPKIDRFISVREAARLQSFPDRYYFMDSQFCQLRQIGNAVPPILARAVAEAVKLGISNKTSISSQPVVESDLVTLAN
ncbi:DNA cytosine methyltransferase [Blastomonas fulva]|uniref:DNA cytosine methyltransferase n=1 Tax=Blastomonas fulva TaxID=1550728 RepID=UPI004033C2F3